MRWRGSACRVVSARARRALLWAVPGMLCLCALGAVPGASTQAGISPTIAATPGPQTGRAAISGVVIDAVAGRLVAGAVVSLGDLDDRQNLPPRMVTDSHGRFVFRDLKPSASYYLGARSSGYAYTRYGWTQPGQTLATADIARLSVTDGQWLADIRIPLWRLGTISGRVVDENGEPVVGVAVRAFSVRHISGRPDLVAGPVVTTDDRGIYRIADLDPARYVVGVLSVQSTVLDTTADGWMPIAVGQLDTGGIGSGDGSWVNGPAIDVDGRHRLALTNFATPPPPDSSQSRAYPALFYPSARAIADAFPVQIDYGDSRTGVDFQIAPVSAVRVSGRLVGAGGAMPGFLLRLLPAGSERLGFGSEAATTPVAADGSFTFLNVPAGDYTLLAQASVMDFTSGDESIRLPDAPGFPGGGISVGSFPGVPGLGFLARNGRPERFWSRVSVVVGRADITDLQVPLQRAVSVRGHVVPAEGTAKTTRLLMMTEPADGDPTRGRPSAVTTANDPTLSFEINGLIGGTYLLRANGRAVVSIVWNGKDLTETGFDASLGQDFDDVVVTVTDQYAEMSGTVSGQPGQVAAVLAFPVERSRWTNYGWAAERFRTTRAGPSGAFTLDRMLAGDYYLIATDPSKIDAWTDPAFLAAAVPHASRVHVDWGGRATAHLTYGEVVVK
jgi:Carboxypeptidase regulatory-like domain